MLLSRVLLDRGFEGVYVDVYSVEVSQSAANVFFFALSYNSKHESTANARDIDSIASSMRCHNPFHSCYITQA